MAITATTAEELLQSIDSNIRNKTLPNTITPDIHSDLLWEMTQVLSADTNSFVTGGTYVSTASTITFNDNTGGTFTVTGITSGGNTQEYTEVTISSLDIQTKNTKTFVAAQGAGTYIVPSKIIFEYNYGTTPYSWSAAQGFLIQQGNDIALVQDDLITGSADKVAVVTSFTPYNEDVDTGDAQNTTVALLTNQPLTMDYYSVATASGGDGDILVKIWYEVKTVGTEL